MGKRNSLYSGIYGAVFIKKKRCLQLLADTAFSLYPPECALTVKDGQIPLT